MRNRDGQREVDETVARAHNLENVQGGKLKKATLYRVNSQQVSQHRCNASCFSGLSYKQLAKVLLVALQYFWNSNNLNIHNKIGTLNYPGCIKVIKMSLRNDMYK